MNNKITEGHWDLRDIAHQLKVGQTAMIVVSSIFIAIVLQVNPSLLLYFLGGVVALVLAWKRPEIFFAMFVYAYFLKLGIRGSWYSDLTAITLILSALALAIALFKGDLHYPFRFTIADKAFFLFVLIFSTGLLYTNEIDLAADKVVRTVFLSFIPFFFMRFWKAGIWKRTRILLWSMLVFAWIAVILGVLQVTEKGIPDTLFVQRIGIGESYPVAVGLWMGIAALVAMILLLHSHLKGLIVIADTELKNNKLVHSRVPSILVRLALLVSISVFVIYVFLSGTRGAVISLSIASIFLFFMVLRRHRLRKKLAVAVLIVSALYISWNVITILSDDDLDAIRALNYEALIEGRDPSLPNRIDLIEQAGQMFMSSPLIGVGVMGSVQQGGTTYWSQGYPHNIFIEIISENGIIGLVAFLIFIGSIWRYAIQGIRVSNIIPEHRILVMGIWALFVLHLILAQTSLNLESQKGLFLFAGWMLGITSNIRQSKKE